MWMPRESVGCVVVKLPGVMVAVAGVHGPCQVSTWKCTASTGRAVGENVLLAVKVNEGVGLVVWLVGSVLIAVVRGIVCTCCSVRTITSALVLLVTEILFVAGFTAISLGLR